MLTKEQLASFDRMQELAKGIVEESITLFGPGGGAGRIPYTRGLAIQRLEECMHRMSDGMAYLDQLSPEQVEKTIDEALGKSQLQVVKGGA